MKLRNSPRDYARRMEAKSRYSMIEDSEGEANAAAGFLVLVCLIALMIVLGMLARGWL